MTRNGEDNCVGLESVVGGCCVWRVRVCSSAAPTLKRVVVVRGLEVGTEDWACVCGCCWLTGGLSGAGRCAADSDDQRTDSLVPRGSRRTGQGRATEMLGLGNYALRTISGKREASSEQGLAWQL